MYYKLTMFLSADIWLRVYQIEMKLRPKIFNDYKDLSMDKILIPSRITHYISRFQAKDIDMENKCW